MKMANCPGCGKPLVKRSSKGRYYCETEGCPVIFVQRPHNIAIRRIVYKPSTSEKTIREIEKRPRKLESYQVS
jgi:ribosomal protein L37AE/L43A